MSKITQDGLCIRLSYADNPTEQIPVSLLIQVCAEILKSSNTRRDGVVTGKHREENFDVERSVRHQDNILHSLKSTKRVTAAVRCTSAFPNTSPLFRLCSVDVPAGVQL